jgi:phosphotransferase system enzyme I (PtsI)
MKQPNRKNREMRWEGIGVCQGVAIGKAFLVDDPRGRTVRMSLTAAQIPAEIERFRAALLVAQQQVATAKAKLEASLGVENAFILDAHLLMLQDAHLAHQIETFIHDHCANAEWAVREVTNHLRELYSQVADEYLRERGSDIADVALRLLKTLAGSQTHDLNELANRAIVIADDLLPSAAAELDTNRVLGFVTNIGGWASHTAIIARGLNLPAVVGVKDFSHSVRSGETIIVDGTSGTVILRPSPETLRFYTEQQDLQRQQQLSWIEERELPATTRDGHTITLRANIELLEEIEIFQRFNATGVGLYRSEFLYSQGMPTEEEQYEAYKLLAEMTGEDGASIRTFDLGGDKLQLDGFKPERNPALGLRAIRLSLAVTDIFRTQIRAILRAGVFGKLRILLPFISNLDELRQAKQLIAECERDLRQAKIKHAEDVEIGVMIEIPAAVILADPIAHEADFFSLGTNDLTQSLLAVDRGNENVNALFDCLHPAVLRAVKAVADAALRQKIPVNVCGEMASNPAQCIVLLGLGMKDLSMTPTAIPTIRRLVRSLELSKVQEIAAHALTYATPADVNRYVNQKLSEYSTQLFAAAAHA